MSTMLTELWELESEALYRFAWRRSESKERAEDVVADVFMAACAATARNRGETITGAWLMAVARRRLIDGWRRDEVSRRRGGWLRADVERDVADFVVGDERVVDALGVLPPRQRDAVVMKYLGGLRTSEVAQRLGVSPVAVDSLLARARRALANEMA